MNAVEIINNKLTKLEYKIIEASTEPIGFSVYNLEGYLAQVKILQEVLIEIETALKTK